MLASVTYCALAPQVRLELTTLRLTAECSAIELLRNNGKRPGFGRTLRLGISRVVVKLSRWGFSIGGWSHRML